MNHLFHKGSPSLQIHAPDEDIRENRESMAFTTCPPRWIIPAHVRLTGIQTGLTGQVSLHVFLEDYHIKQNHLLHLQGVASLSLR